MTEKIISKLTAEAAVGAMELDLQVVRAGITTALERLADWQAVGYPSTASGANSAGGSTSFDEESGPLFPRDEFGPKRDRLYRALDMAREGLREAATLVHESATVRRPKRGELQDRIDDRWCRSHARFNLWTGRMADRRNCSWCDKFIRANGIEPPKELLDMHDRGDNIYQRDVDRILKRTRPKAS